MQDKVQFETNVPVTSPFAGQGRIAYPSLPAGRPPLRFV